MRSLEQLEGVEIMLTYKVAAKYAKGPEKLIAKFDSQAEAKEYIQQKLENDIQMKVAVTYLLYDTGELMGTFDQSNATGDSSSASGSGQQQAARQSFSPSPLATTLRPSGMPPSSFKDVVGDDKKK